MSVIDMASATRLASIQVGAALSHPAGVVVDSAGTRAYVALSNADQVAVVNLSTRRVVRTISVGSNFGLGDDAGRARARSVRRAPVRRRVRRRCAGGDPPAAARDARQDFTIVGRVPTAEQPEAVLTSSAQGGQPARLIWIAARGADTGPLPKGPNPVDPNDPIFWAFHPIPPPTVDIFNQGDQVRRGRAHGRGGPDGAPLRRADRQAHPGGQR